MFKILFLATESERGKEPYLRRKQERHCLSSGSFHFYMRSVFDFYDWCNTLPQTKWWRQRSLLSYRPVGQQSEKRENGLTVLESMGQPGCIPSGGSREESAFLPFSAFKYCSYSLALSLLHLQSQRWWAFSFLISSTACSVTNPTLPLPSDSLFHF